MKQRLLFALAGFVLGAALLWLYQAAPPTPYTVPPDYSLCSECEATWGNPVHTCIDTPDHVEPYTEDHLRTVEENARLFATHMEMREEVELLKQELLKCRDDK